MVHGIKKNMPNKLIDLNEKILLRKRNIIETVFDYLKNKMNLEHTRHRSPINAFVHILSTFISYCFKKNKPSINYGFDLSLNYALIPNWGKDIKFWYQNVKNPDFTHKPPLSNANCLNYSNFRKIIMRWILWECLWFYANSSQRQR